MQLLRLTAAGIISKRWWRSHAATSPGALAAKLSRRARHHGAIFAVPAKDKIIPERWNYPEPVARIWNAEKRLIVQT